MTSIIYTFVGILIAATVAVFSFVYVDFGSARSTGEARSVAAAASMMIERLNSYRVANGALPSSLEVLNSSDAASSDGMLLRGVIAGIPDAQWTYEAAEGDGLSRVCLSVPADFRDALVKAQPLLEGTRGIGVSDRCNEVPMNGRAVLRVDV